MRRAARYVARWEVGAVRGVVVAVDVLRAFTTAAYAFDRGAECILLTAGVDEAISLARTIPRSVTMGEEGGRRPAGFDFSNSPVEIAGADLSGRVVVQRTGAGTVGMLAAKRADRLFAASLVCASATAAAVRQAGGDEAPTYLVTGRFPDAPDGGYDDLVAAQLIERARLGKDLLAGTTAAAVAGSEEAARTLAVGEGHCHPDDIAFAVAVDRFAFAMEARRNGDRLRLACYDPGTD